MSFEDLPVEVLYLLVTEYLHPVLYYNLKKTCRFLHNYLSRGDIREKMKKKFDHRITAGQFTTFIDGDRCEYYFDNGNYQSYWRKKKQSFQGHPAIIDKYGVEWYHQDNLHSFNGQPAKIICEPTSVTYFYKNNGNSLSGDNPSFLVYYKTGNRHYEWSSGGIRWKVYDYLPENNEFRITTYLHGSIHSYNGEPSIIRCVDNFVSLKWHKMGKICSFDGNPSSIEIFYGHHQIQKTWHNQDGELERLDGPAFVMTFEGGSLEKWYCRGVLESFDDQPAIINKGKHYYMVEYYQNGHRHRNDGPAVVEVRDIRGNDKKWWRSTDLRWYRYDVEIGRNFYWDEIG